MIRSTNIKAVIGRLAQMPDKVELAVAKSMQSVEWAPALVGIAATIIDENNIVSSENRDAILKRLYHETRNAQMRFSLSTPSPAAPGSGRDDLIRFVKDISLPEIRQWVMRGASGDENGKDLDPERDPRDENGNWDVDKIAQNVQNAIQAKPEQWIENPGKEGSLITEASRGLADIIPDHVLEEIATEWRKHICDRLPKKVAQEIREALSSEPF